MECAVRIKAMSISCAHACAFYLCVPVRSQPNPTLRPFLSAQKETFLEMLRSRIHGLKLGENRLYPHAASQEPRTAATCVRAPSAEVPGDEGKESVASGALPS